MRVLVLASIGLLLAACGGPAAPCPVPTGCVRVERASGACSCAEWQTVSTEAVALPFVVIDVTYWPVGTASVFRYGVTDPAAVPRSASSTGTTVRAVIRRADGAEQMGRVGSLPDLAPLERVSETTLMLWRSTGMTSTFTSTAYDVQPPGYDWITVWTNAVATVVTNAAGEKLVDWSTGPKCFAPIVSCAAGEPLTLSPRLIRGDVSWGEVHDAYLATLTAEDRAALLAFDPREAGGALGLPRYQLIADDVPVGPGAEEPEAAWQPCTGEFEVLAETAVPLAGGDTFVLQYGVQSDGTCTPQRPGVLVGTTTPGCALDAQLLVDRLAGTLLARPRFATPECTTAP